MPIITLTTDIGDQDSLTGAVKGRLLQCVSNAVIIDNTHGLSPFNYHRSAYLTRQAIQNFSRNTYHIVILNLFDERPDHLLLAKHNDQYILCADNGLLTMVLEEVPQQVVALGMGEHSRNILGCIKVFGTAIQSLENGNPIDKLGDPEVSIQVKNPLRPLLYPGYMEGQIIFIDNFENVVVNITKEEFEEQRRGRSFKIVFRRDETIDRISETYADVPQGEKLAMFNSSGYLEIAINKGNAAGLLGLQGYSDNQQSVPRQVLNNRLIYQTVKIFFD